MPTIISFINLKGGVGKTTSAVALAEHLRAMWEKRVLVIDLDPQTNLTIAFISALSWRQRHDKGQTIAHLFRDKLENTSVFQLDEAILENVSKLKLEGRFGRVDLLPSSIGFVEFQDALLQIGQQTMFATNPVEVLREAVTPILNNYDYVIIDCPPNLGTVTLNGILMSDYYVLPTIPDPISVFGIPLILSQVGNFRERQPDCHIDPLGILPTLVRGGLVLHANTINELDQNAAYPKLFEARIPLTVNAARAFDPEENPERISQKYPGSLGTEYQKFTQEILSHAGQS